MKGYNCVILWLLVLLVEEKARNEQGEELLRN
jgi:hypothetical protein